MKSPWLFIAGLNGLVAVIMGAVAAHAIADASLAALAEKASNYQLIHAAVLLVLAPRADKTTQWARRVFLFGIVLFSGSLYIKALTGFAAITHLAPLGGLSLMAGWALLAAAAFKA